MAKKKDQGYTMIIVMCLMFLFMALALSMLFSSALLLARAERAAAQKQSRVSAISFTEWMDKELEKGFEDPDKSPLCENIKKRIYDDKNWPSYTGGFGHEADVAILKFKPDTSDTGTSELKNLGELEVSMYWERPDGSAAVPEINDPEMDLVVTVKAVVRDEQYSITTRYEKSTDTETLDDETSEEVWKGKWDMEGRE